MDTGALRHRVTLQQATITRDAVGGPVEGWSDMATVWGDVYDLTGRAINEAMQVGSRITRRVTIRWRSGIDDSLRVRFADGRVAKVAHVREPAYHVLLELHCEMIDG
jgi:SPP1 family predicted phage head-tail adaptor